jgi:hypothetical protein
MGILEFKSFVSLVRSYLRVIQSYHYYPILITNRARKKDLNKRIFLRVASVFNWRLVCMGVGERGNWF